MYMLFPNLIHEMKYQGWTREKLAERICVSDATLGMKMRGESAWKLREMKLIRDVLNLNRSRPEPLTMDFLFCEETKGWDK